MPPNLEADKLAQRIHDARLMETREIEAVLAKAGGRGQADIELFISLLLRGEHLTNWQLTRLVEGQRKGYFYNDWKILYLIGVGTFARVYRAYDVKSGDIKAIKVLRSRHSSNDEMREHFLREGRMVMKLRHPNIVPIYEVDEDRGRIYMVMDFVEGQNLRDYVKAHRKLSVPRALGITRDIAAGLAYAAGEKINHRDMKLSNVLLSSRGQAKLVDFGLATVAGDSGELTGGPRSIDYAGLERTTGVKRDDKRSDIFFLGCMLYQMLTGVPPMLETRERMKRLSADRYKEIAPVTVHEPNLPHRVVLLLTRLMDIDPSRRIQTPQLAHTEIEHVLEAVERGDAEKFDENMSRQQAEDFAKMISAREEGKDKTVMVIDSNQQVQNSLREKLKKIGYRVLITSDPQRGLERFRDLDPAEGSPADAVIFGCGGLGGQAIMAFQEFVTSDRMARTPAILVITDKLKDHVEPKWQEDPQNAVLSMPLKFKYVQRALRKLLNLQVQE
ncbi:serine/threonine-protein kinase [Mariniblastus fucicola]|uniref:serine/threonine-protein kinase n=1 Tax=Mariniblastus fucicola TaxID=980251 RepID=UPI00143E02D6|nr:serine/threonine-protein kinase [Mariniblastus fucicola]